MTAPDFNDRRNLVEDTLTERQQTEMLGRKADADSWVQVNDDDRARLESLSMMIFALKGGYSASGIQRWFTRPRIQLQNRAPADILSGDWKPSSPDVESVRKLAQTLCGDIEHAAVCDRCNPKPPE